jgi:hypothetical protein
MSIADECFQAQEELERLRRELSGRVAELAQRLESALPELDEGA